MEEAAAYAVGTTFVSPTHTEILERLIRPSIGSELHSGSYITVADVYSAAPNDLIAQHARPASAGTGGDGGHGAPYYFLSPVHHVGATRKSRTVDGTDGKARWHTETGKKLVQGSAGVYMSKLSYQEKSSSGTTKPGGWLMVEYGIDGWDIVIAKVYRSSRRQATPPSWTESSSTAVTMSLHEIESLVTDDDAVDLVESQQAVLANDYPDFINDDNNGNHGALQYLAVAEQYSVSGASAGAHDGETQYLAGQYNVSGGAAGAHDGAPQFLAGQYNVSGAAAPAHGASLYPDGQYNVSGAAAGAHGGAPQFLAGQYNISGAAAPAHGASLYLDGHYNVSSAAAAAAHGAPQYLTGQYNISGATAIAHGAPQFHFQQAVLANDYPDFFNNDNASHEMGTWCTPTPAPFYMESSLASFTRILQEIESFLMRDDDDGSDATPGQV